MPAVQHILFPFDFSTQGIETAAFVRALAQCFHARVTLLSVVPPAFESMPDEMGPRIGDDPTAWTHALKSRLDQALTEELAGLRVERVADSGDPALRIASHAHSHDVDLVMMPTHGLGLFRELLMRSVTSKVLHDAQCPVWTAAHAEAQVAQVLPRTVVCAVDGASATAALVQWAATFSAQIGARLKLLHVVVPITDWPWLAGVGAISQWRVCEHSRSIEARADSLRNV